MTRVLLPPDDGSKVGWWKRSAQPGATTGQSLITGHSLRQGDGAMDNLGDAKPGATVQVYGKKEDGNDKSGGIAKLPRPEGRRLLPQAGR